LETPGKQWQGWVLQHVIWRQQTVHEHMADRFSYIQHTLMLLKQLDALASFCEQVQITVNLSKTQVVVFETRQSEVWETCLQVWITAEASKVLPQLKEVWQQACIGLSAPSSALHREWLPIGQALQQASHAACYRTHLGWGITWCRAAAVTPAGAWGACCCPAPAVPATHEDCQLWMVLATVYGM